MHACFNLSPRFLHDIIYCAPPLRVIMHYIRALSPRRASPSKLHSVYHNELSSKLARAYICLLIAFEIESLVSNFAVCNSDHLCRLPNKLGFGLDIATRRKPESQALKHRLIQMKHFVCLDPSIVISSRSSFGGTSQNCNPTFMERMAAACALEACMGLQNSCAATQLRSPCSLNLAPLNLS